MTKERKRRVLWSAFLTEFATAMGEGAISIPRRQTVVWPVDGDLNSLRLVHYGPTNSITSLTRIAVNHFTWPPFSESLTRRMGFIVRKPDRTPGLTLEWTMLDTELLAFAPWTAMLIRARLDASASLQQPPYPRHDTNKDILKTKYEWTSAAMDSYMAEWRLRNPARVV